MVDGRRDLPSAATGRADAMEIRGEGGMASLPSFVAGDWGVMGVMSAPFLLGPWADEDSEHHRSVSTSNATRPQSLPHG